MNSGFFFWVTAGGNSPTARSQNPEDEESVLYPAAIFDQQWDKTAPGISGKSYIVAGDCPGVAGGSKCQSFHQTLS